MMEGLISHVQRFSTKDGPGIRTTVFMQGCNLRCVWCHNPEMIGNGKILKYLPDRCTDCGSCAAVCPVGASVMKNGRRTYNPEECILCGKCAAACPQDALELIGKNWGARELTSELLRDADYYEDSGGGVTFSGGEPLLQADFLSLVMSLLKDRGILLALDTALCVPWDNIRMVLPYTDLFLLDIKGMDRACHVENTGTDPSLIWENMKRLSSCDTGIIVRMPLVEGLNTNLAEVESAAELMCTWKNLIRVELLPYHSLGVEKSALHPALELQKKYAPPPASFMVEAATILRSHGIAVVF